MAEFEFVDIDPRSTGQKRRNDPLIGEFADALRANPGRWAVYPYPSTAPSNMAWRINHRHSSPQPLQEPGFEAVSRGGKVYVRYIKDSGDD